MEFKEREDNLREALENWASFKDSIEEQAKTFVENIGREIKNTQICDPELAAHAKKAKENAQILKDLHDKNLKTINEWRKEAEECGETKVGCDETKASGGESSVGGSEKSASGSENSASGSETVVNHPPALQIEVRN